MGSFLSEVKPTELIITGCSGAGKHTAMAALEDAGYYCVDNMPAQLLSQFMALQAASGDETAGFAFVMDMRERGFANRFPAVFEEMKNSGSGVEIVFLEAEDEILLHRFSQTRRPHPVSGSRRLIDNIRLEKERLRPIKVLATRIIDTSFYSVHQLRAVMEDMARKRNAGAAMRVQVLSFGFKYGIPGDVDLVVDVRFLSNPYFESELRELDGRSEAVREFIFNHPETDIFLAKYLALLDYLLPLYRREGKKYLTIGVGCTGGKHRSVTIAENIYRHLEKAVDEIELYHRDIDL
jgi:UPF0042 nucleotide-binding protein